MKRRAPRCRVRATSSLSRPLEGELTMWHGWRIAGFSLSPADLVIAWHEHRDVILPRWLASCPGVRPWAMFVAGELPLPPVVRTPRVHATPAVSVPSGGELHEQWCYDIPEHLRATGVVDDAEWQRYQRHRKALGYRWFPGAGYELTSAV